MGSFDFEHGGHKQHYACFSCRKAFKARRTYGTREDREFACPECKQPMTPMGLLFRAPPQRAIKAWRKLEELALRSSSPPFETPRKDLPEGGCPECRSQAGWNGIRCPYCGYSSDQQGKRKSID